MKINVTLEGIEINDLQNVLSLLQGRENIVKSFNEECATSDTSDDLTAMGPAPDPVVPSTPPAAESAAPSTPPAPEQGNAAPQDEEVDTNGVRWDERIHTSNRGKTQKGVWKRKPRVPDDVFDSVMTELKGAAVATLPAPEQAATPPAPPAPEPESANVAQNGQALVMRFITFNMRIGDGGAITQTLMDRCRIQNVNFVKDQSPEMLAYLDNVLSDLEKCTDAAKAQATLDQICPAQQ